VDGAGALGFLAARAGSYDSISLHASFSLAREMGRIAFSYILILIRTCYYIRSLELEGNVRRGKMSWWAFFLYL
jgi:hypothetical protein